MNANGTEVILIRKATADDDLSLLLGDIAHHTMNPESILVASSLRGIEGMLVVFDSGHSVIYADHLVVRADAPAKVGPHLILALNSACQHSGKTAIFLVSGSVALAYMGEKRGAQVEGPLFRIRYDVTCPTFY